MSVIPVSPVTIQGSGVNADDTRNSPGYPMFQKSYPGKVPNKIAAVYEVSFPTRIRHSVAGARTQVIQAAFFYLSSKVKIER